MAHTVVYRIIEIACTLRKETSFFNDKLNFLNQATLRWKQRPF